MRRPFETRLPNLYLLLFFDSTNFNKTTERLKRVAILISQNKIKIKLLGHIIFH